MNPSLSVDILRSTVRKPRESARPRQSSARREAPRRGPSHEDRTKVGHPAGAPCWTITRAGKVWVFGSFPHPLCGGSSDRAGLSSVSSRPAQPIHLLLYRLFPVRMHLSPISWVFPKLAARGLPPWPNGASARTKAGTRIAALMELPIENAAQVMDSVFVGVFNPVMRIEHERFLGRGR